MALRRSILAHALDARKLPGASRKVRREIKVYTGKFKVYDSLMFCAYRHLKLC